NAITTRVALRRRNISQYSTSRLGARSSMTSARPMSKYCEEPRTLMSRRLPPHMCARSSANFVSSGCSDGPKCPSFCIQVSVVIDRSPNSGRYRRRNKAGHERLSAAGRYNKNILGVQSDVFGLTREYLLDVNADRDLSSRQTLCDSAHNPCFLRL